MSAPGSEPSANRIAGDLSIDNVDPFVRRFHRLSRRNGLITDGTRVVVALSGGLDSTALLHLLRFHPPFPDIQLIAAHFDHRMRDGSTAEAEWVRGLCRSWDVPLESSSARAPLHSEAAARAARYAFLHDVAARVSADRIATAHHADDQAETVLFRLLRGGSGLHGIPARRGIIVRPLLPFRRRSISAYADRVRLSFVEDPSNVDLRWTRNRIRHVALPALERAVPGATKRLVGLARATAESESAWRSIVDEVLNSVITDRSHDRIQLARTPLLGYHRHVARRVLRRIIGDLGTPPGRAGTRAALAFIRTGASGAGIELAAGLRLERHFDHFVIRPRQSGADDDRSLVIPGPAAGSGTATLAGRAWRAEWSADLAEGPQTVTFDPAAMQFPVELRAWRSGDRIRFAYGSKKLKKLFVERRVPRYERHRIPILVQADGQVLWVVGVARTVGAEPEKGGRVFQMRVTDGEDG